jgi:GT2 family glycosyltransferase
MNPTFSVIILCQPAETAVTALTLHHLARDLDGSGSVHVLMNGGFVGQLRTMAPDSPRISYYSSPTNLGVAGGRNFLLRLPEVQDSDVIVVLDNDVITPPGHVERMVAVLMADQHAGVIGPAVLHLPAVSRALGFGDRDVLHAPITNERMTRLGRHLRDQETWFHLGTNPDWRAGYIDELQIEQQLVRGAGGSTEPFYAMNHENPSIRSAIANGSTALIPAANVAGCCQVFRRELLDEVGYLMDEFSPYGYEDVDFCIRVADTGRRNYIDPTIFMLHGTDRRHSDRRTPERVIATQRNFMRCKTLLTWRHAQSTWRTSVETTIVRRYLLARQTGTPGRAGDYLRAHVAGSRDAFRQIEHLAAGQAGNPAW